MKAHILGNNDLSAIFDVMIEGIVVQDESGRIVDFNHSALKILGLSSDQLLGRTSYDPKWRSINEDLSKADPALNPSTQARTTGEVQKNKVMGIHRPNGDLVWVSISAVPIKNKETPPYSTVITFHEITEIINLKKDIEIKKQELKLVMNSLPVLIGHWDKDLKNVHANNAYSFYFGKTPEQIKGLHIKEVLGEKIFEMNYPYMKKALSGELQEFEREIPLPEGGSRHTIASYIPEFNNGNVIGFFVIVTDITQLKKLEKERREMESAVFNSARLSWLGEMAGGMAHEINNPLAIVLGYLNMLKLELNDRPNEIIFSKIENIESALRRISKIVKDLNSLSKDGSKDKLEKVQLTSIFETIQNLSTETLKKKGISLEISAGKNTPILCKTVQMTHVLMSLINNSSDAISLLEEKWIKISVSYQSDFAFIRVTDSGTGIDQIADKIMDPFFTTKNPGKGTGLGLSISKTMMRDQNGDLNYIPAQANTTFELKIPIG